MKDIIAAIFQNCRQREKFESMGLLSLSLCLVILYSEAYFIIAHDKSIKQKSLTNPYDICCQSKAHAF